MLQNIEIEQIESKNSDRESTTMVQEAGITGKEKTSRHSKNKSGFKTKTQKILEKNA